MPSPLIITGETMPQRIKFFIAIVVLILIGSLHAADLPSAFTAKGNPSLYKDMRAKASQNLSLLDKDAAKAYKALLKKYDDVLMSFLIAYEPDANLQLARPQDVAANYLQVRALLEEKGCRYSPEFFLSYIAKQTVSGERIQAYRAAFLDDGLRDIMRSSANDMDIYRAVSQWCVARLVFQPTSGRDQSPLDITARSLYGRCEEMQILFVAAARTVGLPARPASTPWWAHQDNNHAWAEVWLENAWHYTGDMDAAYYPDQTWFSGMIDKTVLILADGTIPDASDEVLDTGRYDVTINSTRNYAGPHTRTLKLLCTDAAGMPIPDVSVGVMVYNWNSLRPIAYVRANADGYLQMSVGRGAFYLLAVKDSLKALQCVPSGEEAAIEAVMSLSRNDFPSQDVALEYPANPFEWKQAPQSWNDGVKLAKQQWEARDAAFRLRAQPIQPTHADSLFWQVAASCRGNYLEFKLFADRNAPLATDFLQFLLDDDPKFLWQADAGQFEAIYGFFLSTPIAHLDSESQHLLIGTSVLYEDLPRPFRNKSSLALYPTAFRQQGANDRSRLEAALRWMNRTYTIDASQALSGLLPMNLAASRKYLAAYQFRMLAVNVARANGIPADYTRMPNVISVLVDGDWEYWDTAQCKEWTQTSASREDSFTFDLYLEGAESLPYDVDPALMSISSYQDGMFHTLNHTPQRVASGQYRYNLPAGKYVWQLGYRASDSRTIYCLESVDGSAAQPVSLRLVFADRVLPDTWKPADAEIIALLNGLDLTGTDVVLIGNYDRENSIRTMDKIKSAGKSSRWFGYSTPSQTPVGYMLLDPWKALVDKDQRNAMRTITLVRGTDGWLCYEGQWDKLP